MQEITVIGAGAIAEKAYLPAVQAHQRSNLHAVVDTDANRARSVAQQFSANVYSTTHHDLLEMTDIAIIATPPQFHAEIAADCLQAGTHVLTEKPVALTSEKARELVAIAEETNTLFGISRQFREAPICQCIQTFVSNGWLGEIDRFSATFGDTTDWDFVSEYRVKPAMAGGGVLTDKGPHILDVICWLFGDDVTIEQYRDDSYGGLEANAMMELSYPESGIRGDIEITGSRALKNQLTIQGSRGQITATPGSNRAILTDRSTGEETEIVKNESRSTGYLYRVGRQAIRFIDAVEGTGDSVVTAKMDIPILSLIESCYSNRNTLTNSWEAVPTRHIVEGS